MEDVVSCPRSDCNPAGNGSLYVHPKSEDGTEHSRHASPGEGASGLGGGRGRLGERKQDGFRKRICGARQEAGRWVIRVVSPCLAAVDGEEEETLDPDRSGGSFVVECGLFTVLVG